MNATTETLNPITYEVIRNRLIAMTEDMRVALQSVSGSPTVTEASDFFTGIYLPSGAFASMGFQVSYQAPVVGTLIREIGKRSYFKLADGDMFCGNDPYIGALHQNDVQLTGPIFVDGELIAWAGVEAHETDVGGMDFASWSPKARSVYQEGMRIPCVKLVEEGVLREDILEMILTASRLPAQLGLDIRAFVATINVARERMTALVRRYGAKTVIEVMHRMIAASKTRLEARLRELPDGKVHAMDWLEHDGHTNALYKIDCALTKTGERLVFDFSASSPQAPGFVNCTRAGLIGAVAGGVFPTLAYDIPWNQGLLDCCEVIAPDGLVVTAKFPAPVGSATVEAVWTASNAVTSALNKLLSFAPRYQHRIQAGNDGTMATFNLGGINQFGEVFGLHLMDPLAGGSGAFTGHDGIAAGGPNNTPIPSIADVERNEQVVPLFYLHRRLATDTGGAGEFRGGLSAEVALTLGGIESAESLIMTHGAEVPNTPGLGGGWPGATVVQSFGADAIAQGIKGGAGKWTTFGPKPGLMPMTNRDIFAVAWQGGGGIGDPLDRSLDALRADLASGAMSRRQAEQVYGVAFGNADVIDAEASVKRRATIRSERRAAHLISPRRTDSPPIATLGSSLALVREGADLLIVSRAGCVLATNSSQWRAGAIAQTFDQPPPEYHIKLHHELAMTAWYCPGSGTLLAVDVHPRGATPRDDIDVDLKAVDTLCRSGTPS